MTSRRCCSPKISNPVGDLGPGGEYHPFRISIRARTPGRAVHGLDARAGQNRVERCGELPGSVADQEPEARGAVAEIHQEIADLLGGPGPVRVRGDSANVHVAGADLDDEQALSPATVMGSGANSVVWLRRV